MSIVHSPDLIGPAVFGCAQAGCRLCQERLVRQHERLVHFVLRRQVTDDVEYADLLQVGRMGLWRAVLIAAAVFRFQFLKVMPAAHADLKTMAMDLEEKRSLALFLFIFVLLVTGIATAAALYYRNYEQQYRGQVERQISAIAELKMNELVLWRQERLGDATVLYKNPAFSNLAASYLENPQDAEAQGLIQAWLESYLTYAQYDQMRLLDTQGVTRLSVPAGVPPVSAEVARRIPEALQSGQVTLVDFYRSDQDQRIYLTLLIPILNAQQGNRAIGLVALRMDPNVYLYPTISQWPTPSTTAETLLIRRDGNDALFLNELKFQKNTALNLRIPLESKDVPAIKAALGQAGMVEGVDYRGVPVIADVRAVPDSPWFLVARMDTAEVYAPLRSRLWQIVIFFGALIAATGAGLVLVWRQQRLRYYQAQVQAVEALRDSEIRYRRLFEAAKDGILILDAETGVIVDVNPFLVEMLGSSHEAICGKALWELGSFRDIAENKANFMELRQKGYIRYEDLPLETADGRRIEVESVSNIYPVDHRKVIQCNIRDITERKRVEEALRETNEYLENLFNYANAPIIVWDPQFKITRFNHAFETLTGRSAAEVLGKSLEILFPPAQIKASMKLIQKTLSGERWEVVEINLQHVDGSIRTVLWNSATLFSADGKIPIATIAQGQDITERKQLEEALAHERDSLAQRVEERTQELSLANLDLARAVRLRDEFLANMSHELHTPLNGILGLSEALQEEVYGPLTPKQVHSLQTIESSGKRLLALVSDILDFAKIGAGKLDVRMGPVLVKSVCQASLRYVEQAAQKKWLTLTSQLDEQVVSLQADERRLRQILVNLLANAVKFTPEGGAVGLEVMGDAERGEARFTVWDTGIGIAPADIARLFQPFTQLDAGLAWHYEGAGLGLALVARLVELHSGRVWAESEPGKGSRFTVAIPWQAVGQETRAGGQVRPAATIGVANRVGDQE
jgi:PAS domain S-box-containing protein